ncbi:MAG TPA: hypothetical protein VF662_11600, partial [Allosphingosinicella sp.]
SLQPRAAAAATTLNRGGKTASQFVAAQPTASFDNEWGQSMIDGALFTRLVYRGVYGCARLLHLIWRPSGRLSTLLLIRIYFGSDRRTCRGMAAEGTRRVRIGS